MYLLASFCKSTANIWAAVGVIVTLAKFIIPTLIIAFGVLDFGKAIIASDEKQINKSTTSLVKRFIAGVVIFILPQLISALFNLFVPSSSQDISVCLNCLTGSECDQTCVVGSSNYNSESCNS